MPFWIFHGSNDQVIPVQPTRNFYDTIVKIGGKQIRYTEYQGVGHNVWDYTAKETTLSSWLLAQRKGSIHDKPRVISNFKGNILPDHKAYLTWDLPPENLQTQDNKVWYCRIYRNGKLLKEVYNNRSTFTDSALVFNSFYAYKISAVNYYFLESEMSLSVNLAY